jgi:hypothetical protein
MSDQPPADFGLNPISLAMKRKTVLPKIVEEVVTGTKPFRAWNTENGEFFIQVLHNPFDATEAQGKTLAEAIDALEVELEKREGM